MAQLDQQSVKTHFSTTNEAVLAQIHAQIDFISIRGRMFRMKGTTSEADLLTNDNTSGWDMYPLGGYMFQSRAVAQKTVVDSDVNLIFVNKLCFERDPTGNALTTGGGVTWSPFNVATFDHWGIAGRKIPASDLNHPSLVGLADEGALIQTAMTWCAVTGVPLQGDYTKMYGTTIPLVFGIDTTGTGSGVRAFGLRLFDVRIGVVGGTWTAADWVLVIGNSKITVNGTPHRDCHIHDLWIDGGTLAHNGVFYSRIAQSHVSDVHTIHCSAILQQIGNNAVLGSGGVNDCGDTEFERLWGRQWLFGETGYNDWSLTTATGLVWRSDDNMISDCNFGIVRRGLEIFGFSQGDMYGGHFWNGLPAEAQAGAEGLKMHNLNGVRLHGVRFDQGALVFKDCFASCYLYDCTLSQYTIDPVRLITTQQGEDLRNFGFKSCNWRSGNPAAVLSTEIDPVTEIMGVWSATLRPTLLGTTGNEGRPFTIGTLQEGNRLSALKQHNYGVDVDIGSLEVTTNGEGVILRSANGSRFKLSVSNAGALNIDPVV